MSDRYVNLTTPATGLSVSSGLPYLSLAFPTTGGVQAIDALGTVLTLSGVSGEVSATVVDTLNNGSSTALSLTHRLSAGVGATNIGVAEDFILPNSVGTLDIAGKLNVSYTDATDGSEDAALGISLMRAGVLTGQASLSSLGLLTLTGGLAFSGASPALTATAANQGIELTPNGSGTLSLSAGATGKVRVGLNAATQIGFCDKVPITRPTVSIASGTLAADLASALGNLGLITLTA